jgi:hypothetical protein
MSMRTTVAFEAGWYLSSEQSMSTVAKQAGIEVPNPGLNIVRAHFPRARPSTTCSRIDAGEPAIWEWLELGFVVTLALSGVMSILLFMTGAGNI